MNASDHLNKLRAIKQQHHTPKPLSTHWPALAVAPGGPWLLRHDGGIFASNALGRPPSSCPYLRAAWPGSLGSRGPLLTCAFEGRCGCLWRPLSNGPSHLGRPVCGSRARRPLGRLPSGCFWFVLRGHRDNGVRMHVTYYCFDINNKCVHACCSSGHEEGKLTLLWPKTFPKWKKSGLSALLCYYNTPHVRKSGKQSDFLCKGMLNIPSSGNTEIKNCLIWSWPRSLHIHAVLHFSNKSIIQ